MNPENSRYDRSAVPDSTWPDGSAVSNWSKAVAALALESGGAQSEEKNREADDAYPPFALAA
jgi:hypothetical protein